MPLTGDGNTVDWGKLKTKTKTTFDNHQQI